MHRMLGSAASSRSDDTRPRETPAPDSLEPKPLSPIGELSPPIIPSSAVSTQVTPPLADDSTNALVKSEPDADHESNSSAERPPGSLGSGGYVHLGAPPRHDSYSRCIGEIHVFSEQRALPSKRRQQTSNFETILPEMGLQRTRGASKGIPVLSRRVLA